MNRFGYLFILLIVFVIPANAATYGEDISISGYLNGKINSSNIVGGSSSSSGSMAVDYIVQYNVSSGACALSVDTTYCNNVNSTVLQYALDHSGYSGVVKLMTSLVVNNNIIIPVGVTLFGNNPTLPTFRGAWPTPGFDNSISKSTRLIMNPSYSIFLRSDSGIQDILIVSSSVNENDAYTGNSYPSWQGTGISLDGFYFRIQNCGVYGFQYGIKQISKGMGGIIDTVNLDNRNDIYLGNITIDVITINNVHIFPFENVWRGSGKYKYYRDGVGIYLSQCDGCVLSNIFMINKRNGIVLDQIAVTVAATNIYIDGLVDGNTGVIMDGPTSIVTDFTGITLASSKILLSNSIVFCGGYKTDSSIGIWVGQASDLISSNTKVMSCELGYDMKALSWYALSNAQQDRYLTNNRGYFFEDTGAIYNDISLTKTNKQISDFIHVVPALGDANIVLESVESSKATYITFKATTPYAGFQWYKTDKSAPSILMGQWGNESELKIMNGRDQSLIIGFKTSDIDAFNLNSVQIPLLETSTGIFLMTAFNNLSTIKGQLIPTSGSVLPDLSLNLAGKGLSVTSPDGHVYCWKPSNTDGHVVVTNGYC